MSYTAAMREKLEKIVEEGKASVESALYDIGREFDTRKDYIVKPAQIAFDVNGGLHARIGEIDTTFTPYSRGQFFSKIGMPSRYYDLLTTKNDSMTDITLAKLKVLAGQNIRDLTDTFAGDGLMFRVVDGIAKGVLSPSYGRHDASPVFEGFIRASKKAGYVPYRGHNTMNRYQMTFILPEIQEISPGEYIVFSITITTSDYGAAANNIEMGVLRVWCTNLAVGFTMLRKVHIGQRFDTVDDFVKLSDTTQALDVRTITSAIEDIVGKSTDLLPVLKEKLEIVAMEGSTQDHQMTKILERVRKDYGKEIFESAKALYDTPSTIEALPSVKGAWRMSNVISLLAQSQPADIRLDMQREAFNILDIAA